MYIPLIIGRQRPGEAPERNAGKCDQNQSAGFHFPPGAFGADRSPGGNPTFNRATSSTI